MKTEFLILSGCFLLVLMVIRWLFSPAKRTPFNNQNESSSRIIPASDPTGNPRGKSGRFNNPTQVHAKRKTNRLKLSAKAKRKKRRKGR